MGSVTRQAVLISSISLKLFFWRSLTMSLLENSSKLIVKFLIFWDSLYGIGIVVNSPVNSGNVRDVGSTPGSGRSPGGGHSSPLQFSCLGIPMDRGAWRATIHGVAKSQTRLKRLSTHAHWILWWFTAVVFQTVCQAQPDSTHSEASVTRAGLTAQLRVKHSWSWIKEGSCILDSEDCPSTALSPGLVVSCAASDRKPPTALKVLFKASA